MIMSDEDLLRPAERELKPYPPKYIELKDGNVLVIREITRDDVPTLLNLIRPAITIPKDYYDVVAARAYSELLAWYRYRVRDAFCLVGQVNGEVVGMVNSRLYTDKIGMSLHTMAFRRGVRAGANLFHAKMEHHFALGNEEVLIVAESPIGFRRWMEELKLQPASETGSLLYHELGGVDSWVMTKDTYENHVVPNMLQGKRPVPEDIMETTKKLIIPPEDVIVRRINGEHVEWSP